MNYIRKYAFDFNLQMKCLLNGKFRYYYTLMKKGDDFSASQIRELQSDLFTHLMQHCHENVPYYRQVMDQYGLTPSSFKSIDDITLLPLLTKDVIRANKALLFAGNIDPGKCTTRRSGGTTGEPVESILENDYYGEVLAFWRGLRWMGWEPGMTIIELMGGSLGTIPDRKFDIKSRISGFIYGSVLLPAFGLNPDNAKDYLNKIRSSGTCVIIGYPSALLNLATLAENSNIKCPDIKYIYTTAELLPEDWRKKISSVFNCNVKSFYGCGEINSLGFQTTQGGGYLIPEEHVYMESELLDENDSQESLVVTSLLNKAQPLIRFVNGDMGKLTAPGTNHHSRKTIDKLYGRTADQFKRKDGSFISSILGTHSVFMSKVPVKKYQYIQTAYDEVEFRYLSDVPITDQHIHSLKTIFENQFGYNLRFIPRQTDEFMVSENKKHRIMISLVK